MDLPDSAPRELVDAPSALLEAPWDGQEGLTHAMLIAWYSRPDLQKAFDLRSTDGRRRFRRWYRAEKDGRGLHSRLWRGATGLSHRLRRLKSNPRGAAGANLIGYAQGLLGMGEHVRMSAAAMAAANIPGGVLDFTLGLGPRRQPLDEATPKLRWARHRCNLFHINADQMLRAYLHLGPSFFEGRYNIGSWAWELANWPREWMSVIGTVDEIWAPSRFIQNALAPATSKPVEWMPLCVELPTVRPTSRSEFGVDDGDFLFVFTFDGHSYIERKNPIAIVRAFRAAFPRKDRAALIIKVMNSQMCGERWVELNREAALDARIRIIDEIWPRNQLLSLIQDCDAYVSLHRSEGFGRGPAEAMLMGKPVIVTDYSGTADFCRQDNALLVDYDLVEVAPGSYVGSAGQVWADPSIEHAAQHMRALFDDRMLGPRVGAKGRQTISEEFGAAAVGQRYRDRLLELGMI